MSYQARVANQADDIIKGVRGAAPGMPAREFRREVDVRPIERMELYDADDVFLAGAGVQVPTVTTTDGHASGGGRPRPLTREPRSRYLLAVRGGDPAYAGWLTPVYSSPERVAGP